MGVLNPFMCFFHSACHQLPQRSFSFNGQSLAVCHRCLGLYLGFWVGLVLLPHLHTLRSQILKTPRCELLCTLPLLLDVVITNSVWSRLATGMIATFPIAFLVEHTLEQLCSREYHALAAWRKAA